MVMGIVTHTSPLQSTWLQSSTWKMGRRMESWII